MSKKLKESRTVICGMCKKPFESYTDYKRLSNARCTSCSKIVMDRAKKARLEKYGSLEEAEKQKQLKRNKTIKNNPDWGKDRKEIWKKTILEHYGTMENWKNQRDIKSKITINKDPLWFEKREAKRRATIVEKYGTMEDYYSYVLINQKKTMLEKYGVESALQLERFKKKSRETNLKKYGTEYATQSEVVKTKAKKTIESKPDFYKKRNLKSRDTFLKKYGTEHFMQSEEGLRHYQETLKERYGVINPHQLKGAGDKAKATVDKKYGGYKALWSTDTIKMKRQKRHHLENLEKFKNLDFSKYSLKFIYKDDTFFTECTKCGEITPLIYPPSHIHKAQCQKCFPIQKHASRAEIEINSYIKALGYKTVLNSRKYLDGKEIDIFIPELNLGIEYDGIYWHSELMKGKKYHIDKTKLAEKKGIRIIHIWENEYINNKKLVLATLSSLLGKSKKIGGRKTDIREVGNKEYKLFLEENHLQGYIAASIKLGLYQGTELVSVMSFGKSRFNKKYNYELLRFCEKQGVHVLGGKAKLLKHFENRYKGNIISYCDYRWFGGTSYEKLGFSLERISSPNYYYFKDSLILKSRQQFQKHKLKNIEGFNFDESKTEVENMIANNYNRIFDCGMKVFVKERQDA